MIVNGHPIPKEKCIKSIDALDHASWFQHIASGGPILLISRILRDFIQSNEYWIELNEFDVEVHLDHLLSLEYNMVIRSGFTSLPSQCGSPRNMLSVPSDFFHPSKLLRRFFESMANGYLFFAVKHSSSSNNTEDSPRENNIPVACTKPFYVTISNGISDEVCEKITVSAQQIVRQIAFNQLYKVSVLIPALGLFFLYFLCILHQEVVLRQDTSEVECSADDKKQQNNSSLNVSSVANGMETQEFAAEALNVESECTPAKRTRRATANSKSSI
ncbi:unnamed protein product [Schistosoma mattheei]|uniref:Uncharacterized protein n=1 Tax=Schistosoma mattheei TaxID=31246 RepID=A0A3P8HIS5_9TREM|nr:unnamed protein product [Schistosoma mattheei]